jgi:hypothetical protein
MDEKIMYYYAPIYINPSNGMIMPGMHNESGELISPEKDYAPGTRTLHIDEESSIFILESTSFFPGWIFKSKDEVNADYPGVLQ